MKLMELYPTFRIRLSETIVVGVRSPADQLKCFQSGHSKLKYGFHNVTNGEKESLAVNMLVDDAPLAPSTRYLLRLAAAAQWQGFIQGSGGGSPP